MRIEVGDRKGGGVESIHPPIHPFIQSVAHSIDHPLIDYLLVHGLGARLDRLRVRQVAHESIGIEVHVGERGEERVEEEAVDHRVAGAACFMGFGGGFEVYIQMDGVVAVYISFGLCCMMPPSSPYTYRPAPPRARTGRCRRSSARANPAAPPSRVSCRTRP